MNTPICSFLTKYVSDNNLRLHMPGHKGIGEVEQFDITEIRGADSLYEANGIIKESESNASKLFGCHTLYSAEGSSLAIRAMLHLVCLMNKGVDNPVILAGRNAHKVFVSAAALCNFDIEWLYGENTSYLSCSISAKDVAEKLDSMEKLPLAVYITSPDYLGNMADIEGIAKVCHERSVLLLVDNAHGAYLAFTEPSMHPITLGADMCADSAHKSLPCLTGSAYLHLADTIPEGIKARAKSALALFGSTSPSYLILASLDMANRYLSNGYKDKLAEFSRKLAQTKANLTLIGYDIVGDEPMKLTLRPKSYGYTGYEIADILAKNKIVPEFYDDDYIVLMPTPEITEEEIAKLEVVLLMVKKRAAITTAPPVLGAPTRRLSPREAIFSDAEAVNVNDAVGRVLADITVGCPPAVPIVVSGEEIDENTVRAFEYYGIDKCSVVK
jgi:arginine/lysine/ornithine decarboxylase